MTDLRKLALELAEKTRQCAADGSELLSVESAILTGMRAALAEPDSEMVIAGMDEDGFDADVHAIWNAMARVRADSLDH